MTTTTASEDPRSRRTRELLLDALSGLLRRTSFDRISVSDVTNAARVNRATFYAHFPDKFALLDGLVTARFDAMLESRGVVFDGCAGAFAATILAACDYLDSAPWAGEADRASPPPHFEAATIAVIRRRLLSGMREESSGTSAACGRAEMIASAAAWATYGAVREWLARPGRVAAVDVVETIRELVEPILATAPWRGGAGVTPVAG